MKLTMRIEQDYLRVPVQISGAETRMRIFQGDRKRYEFTVSLPEGSGEPVCDFYGELPVQELKGSVVQIEFDREIPDTVQELFTQSSDLLPREAGRYPWIHFAPKSGWLNDPNGLCWYNGEYHLFFQHNLFDVKWNNISWGHAVSRDLLHWEQLEDAILPDEDGLIYSGSAIADGGRLELFYTSAGGRSDWSSKKKFCQKMAWSQDGRTFVKEPQEILPFIVNENRDPKVYWHDASESYYMVLFLDGHDYGIFVSKNKIQWELAQKLTIPESWECPDLMAPPVAGETEEQPWVFWTADGFYLVGTFDGSCFTAKQNAKCIYGPHKKKEAAEDTQFRAYAAQTFWGTQGRTVQIPWLTHARGPVYHGIMGLPRELELMQRDNEYVLAAHLIREIYEQKQQLWAWENPEAEKECSYAWNENGAAVLELIPADSRSFEVRFCGVSVVWDEERKNLLVEGHEPVQLDTVTDLVLTADKGVVEIGCCQDTLCFYVETELEFQKKLSVHGNMKAIFGVVK